MRFFGRKGFRKKKKIIIAVVLGVLLSFGGSVCYLYFNAEQIQDRIEEKTCLLVLKYEEELSETIAECKENGIECLRYRDIQEDDPDDWFFYKELNSKTVNKMFRTFRLLSVTWCEDDKIVHFGVRPTVVSVLWEDYGYGFYYTEQDKAYNVWNWTECDEETEEIALVFGKYRYRTRRIDAHWWFYESKIVERYSMRW